MIKLKNSDLLASIVAPLLHWYDANARVLPWREKPEPYSVWISEIMLQQTRVEAVKPYFDRFLKELPDIPSLASAPESQLLKLWEGLGYYNRVRNLQKAARVLVEAYHAELPASYEELKKLPGLGEYTAGAIASIAFGIPVSAVDGNVMRVISRICASFEDITKTQTKKAVITSVNLILPKDRVSDFNQALMELGAMICIPNGAPKCNICPLSSFCKGLETGVFEQIPIKTPKKQRKTEQRTVLLYYYQNKIAIQKRAESGLLSGLWEFPNLSGNLTAESVRNICESKEGRVQKIQTLRPAKHLFTHIEWQMNGYLLCFANPLSDSDLLWVSKSEIMETYTLPSAFKVYLNIALQLLS